MYVHALPIDLPSPSRCSAELHNLQCKANNLNVAIRPPTSNSHPRVSTPPRDLTTLVLASEKAAPTSQAQPINLLYFVQNSTLQQSGLNTAFGDGDHTLAPPVYPRVAPRNTCSSHSKPLIRHEFDSSTSTTRTPSIASQVSLLHTSTPINTINKALNKEVAEHEMAGPLHTPPYPNIRCSGIGVIPKKDVACD